MSVQAIERAPERAPDSPRLLGGRIGVPTVLLIVLMVVGGAGLLWLGRRLGFYFDEWTTIAAPPDSVNDFLKPFNEHLSVVPAIVYRTLFATVGIGHYWPYRVVLLIADLACVALLYVLVKRRLGGWAALIPAVLLMFMADSADNLLWAATMTPVGATAMGLGAFVLLDRPSRRNDIWACVLLCLAVASTGQGLAFCVGVALQVLMEPGRKRRWWIFVVPLGMYMVWRVAYSAPNAVTSSTVPYAVQYIVDAAMAAAAGITGLTLAYGSVIFVGGAGAVALLRRGDLRAPLPSPRLAAAAGTALAFWGLAALARGTNQDAGAPRYISTGAILLILVAAELLPSPRRWTPWMIATALVVVAGLTYNNIYHLRDSSRFFRNIWEPLRGEMAGVEVAGTAAHPDVLVDNGRIPNLHVGPFLRATSRFGSATGGLNWLLTEAPDSRRANADAEIATTEQIVPLPSASVAQAEAGTGPVPVVQQPTNGTASVSGQCAVFTPTGDKAFFVVPVTPGAAISVSTRGKLPISLAMRRFAQEFAVKTPPIPAPGAGVIRTVRDGAPTVDWYVYINAPQRVRVCPVA